MNNEVKLNITSCSQEYIGYRCEQVKLIQGFLRGLNYHKTIPNEVLLGILDIGDALEHFFKINNAVKEYQEHINDNQ